MKIDEVYDDEGNLIALDIEWDDEDPEESQFNDWTEDDFLEAIKRGLNDDDANIVGGIFETVDGEGLHPTGQSEDNVSGVCE